MAIPTLPPPQSVPPMAPPDEQFWEKYSPHFEFPLSSIGSIALHVAGLMIFLGALYMLSKMSLTDTAPVPMREMMVASDGDGGDGGAPGEGGGKQDEKNTPFDVPMDPKRDIPDPKLQELLTDLKDFVPNIPQDNDAPKLEDLPNLKKFKDLNAELREKLLQGDNGKKGKGPGDGASTTEQPGAGTGGDKDASSSKRRAVRWELLFKTENGSDYVNQLAAMKGTLVIPQPPDFQKSLAYKLGPARPAGEPFDINNVPGLYFVDDSRDSAAKVAATLGLNFEPPLFVAFFPKDIEEELAAKERAWRGRKEDQIFSTKFKVLVRDGKFTITVVDQIPVKR